MLSPAEAGVHLWISSSDVVAPRMGQARSSRNAFAVTILRVTKGDTYSIGPT
jgi:hypothetical protein